MKYTGLEPMVLPCGGNVTSMCAVKILAKYGCGSHLIHEFSSLELMGEDLQTKSTSTAPCECLSHAACSYNVSTVATTSYSHPLYTVYNFATHIWAPLVIKHNNTCEKYSNSTKFIPFVIRLHKR